MTASQSGQIKNMKLLERSCPLCAKDESHLLPYGPPDWPMVECVHCHMVYLRTVPDVSELFQNLAWEKTSQIEHERREKTHGWLRKISRLTRLRLHLFPRNQIRALVDRYAEVGNVLDVGSGAGAHVLSLSEKYIPYGIEVSKTLADQGREEFVNRGGQMINRDAFSGLKEFADNMFTCVIMRSFLEHDITPLPVLREAFRTLKQNGILIIKVPNFASINRKVRGKKWCGLRFPDHVNYFTPQSLSSMVFRAGFSIKRFRLRDHLPTSDSMWMIASKN